MSGSGPAGGGSVVGQVDAVVDVVALVSTSRVWDREGSSLKSVGEGFRKVRVLVHEVGISWRRGGGVDCVLGFGLGLV